MMSVYRTLLKFVSLLRRFYFNVGSRTDSRGSFLCLSKEKNPKETTPEFRLNPVLLAFDQGCVKGLHTQRTASLPRPFGLFRSKAAMLGANYGTIPGFSEINN